MEKGRAIKKTLYNSPPPQKKTLHKPWYNSLHATLFLLHVFLVSKALHVTLFQLCFWKDSNQNRTAVIPPSCFQTHCGNSLATALEEAGSLSLWYSSHLSSCPYSRVGGWCPLPGHCLPESTSPSSCFTWHHKWAGPEVVGLYMNFNRVPPAAWFFP